MVPVNPWVAAIGALGRFSGPTGFAGSGVGGNVRAGLRDQTISDLATSYYQAQVLARPDPYAPAPPPAYQVATGNVRVTDQAGAAAARFASPPPPWLWYGLLAIAGLWVMRHG